MKNETVKVLEENMREFPLFYLFRVGKDLQMMTQSPEVTGRRMSGLCDFYMAKQIITHDKPSQIKLLTGKNVFNSYHRQGVRLPNNFKEFLEKDQFQWKN